MKPDYINLKNNRYKRKQYSNKIAFKGFSRTSMTKAAVGLTLATGAGGTALVIANRKKIKAFIFDVLASRYFKSILDPIAQFTDNWWAKPNPEKFYKEFAVVKKGEYYRGIRPVSFQYYKIMLQNPDYSRKKTLERFQRFQKNGIKTIIDLSRANKQVRTEESRLARQFGIEYKNIPLSGLRPPETKEISNFFKIIKNSLGAIYVHCIDGKDRTGIMTALSRITRDKMSWTEAYNEMKEFKYSDEKFPKLKEFLQNFSQSDKYKKLRKELTEMW